MKIYFAGPLFTKAERDWNKRAAGILEELGYEVFLPQRDAPQADFSNPNWQRLTFFGDIFGLTSSDVILANLNGPMADDGTCFEVGVAYATGLGIIAYRDDWRHAGDSGKGNLMLT